MDGVLMGKLLQMFNFNRLLERLQSRPAYEQVEAAWSDGWKDHVWNDGNSICADNPADLVSYDHALKKEMDNEFARECEINWGNWVMRNQV